MPRKTYPHTIELVRVFHETYKHPVAKHLTSADEFYRRLRVKLIASELAELCQALGVSIELEVKALPSPLDPFALPTRNGMGARLYVAPTDMCYANQYVDLVEAADALADIDYVTQGSNIVFGFPAGLVMQEVQRSNLSKLGADGQPIWDEDGKVVKGPNYSPPDIKTILATFDPEVEL